MNDQTISPHKSSDGKLYNEKSRNRKALKIRAMIHDFLGKNLSGQLCLDVGCSIGVISSVLAQDFSSVIGIDLDQTSINQARENFARENVSFIIANGIQAPFYKEKFDVLICAQCYEHVSDVNRLHDEVYRLLKPGGICVFTGPNRLSLIEDHYGLPFLSWLPHSLADAYLCFMNRGQVYDIRPMTYWNLRNLWKDFEVKDYILQMLRDPEKYLVDDEITGLKWIGRMPRIFIQMMLIFAPNYNWILQKPKQELPEKNK